MPSTGTPLSSTARSQRGAPSSDTLFGPPDRMMPTGRAPGNLCRRRVEGKNLGVNGQLAQPARNQLRELRAEIEDDDGLMRHVLVIVGMNRTTMARIDRAVSRFQTLL